MVGFRDSPSFEDEGDFGSAQSQQLFLVHLQNVPAFEGYSAADPGGRQQGDDGQPQDRFSGTAFPDQGQGFARGQVQVSPAQGLDRPAVGQGKMNGQVFHI